MNTAFSTALSGLNADSDAINIIGNDLANLNTTGYKANEVQFSDLMSQSLGAAGGSDQVGLGVSTPLSVRNFTQGSLQTTGGPTDAAIQGNGFFVVKNQNNQTLYTRDGSFQIDAAGHLVTATGSSVQGWSAANGVINPNGPVGSISLPPDAIVPATATTTMNLALNLNSEVATTDPGATFTSPIQVIDSQGSSHTLTVTFNKTATNSWKYTVTIPAGDLTTGGATQVATGTMTFDANGNLTSPSAASDPQVLKIAGLADGAADLSINWNLYNNGSSTITQLAEASGVAGTTQNGFGAGQVTDVALQDGGLLVASYSNGKKVTVGQIAMASIANPESLAAVGNNDLAATGTTSTPAIGAAGTGSQGQIVSGSLESSTVDIAQEFTNLLTFQRSYQADSRIITTSDQLLQDTINLIHP